MIVHSEAFLYAWSLSYRIACILISLLVSPCHVLLRCFFFAQLHLSDLGRFVRIFVRRAASAEQLHYRQLKILSNDMLAHMMPSFALLRIIATLALPLLEKFSLPFYDSEPLGIGTLVMGHSLFRSLARLLALLTCLLAPHCLLHSRAPLSSLACSLIY